MFSNDSETPLPLGKGWESDQCAFGPLSVDWPLIAAHVVEQLIVVRDHRRLPFLTRWRVSCLRTSRLEKRLASAAGVSRGSSAGRYKATIGFWDCADQIERWAGRGYSNVLWYLVSDSHILRCAAVMCDSV